MIFLHRNGEKMNGQTVDWNVTRRWTHLQEFKQAEYPLSEYTPWPGPEGLSDCVGKAEEHKKHYTLTRVSREIEELETKLYEKASEASMIDKLEDDAALYEMVVNCEQAIVQHEKHSHLEQEPRSPNNYYV